MPNNALQEYLSVKFRKLLSGDPNGIPPWLAVVAGGDDVGYFEPDDAPWVVHADFGTLVGGIRALLMQALHPGTLAGVAQHSRYEQDALGRLAGTIRWLTVTTFGSKTAVAAEANRVNRLHSRVNGEYQTAAGETRGYRAVDADLLLWVHIAFMDSFLRAHQMYAWREIPGGADRYVRLWAQSVEPLGLTETSEQVPTSEAELKAQINRYLDENILTVNESTLRVLKFIRKPPLPVVAGLVYRLLFSAAVLSLEPRFAKMLSLKQPKRWLVQPATRFTLRAIRFAIGPDSPIEDSARVRIARVSADAADKLM